MSSDAVIVEMGATRLAVSGLLDGFTKTDMYRFLRRHKYAPDVVLRALSKAEREVNSRRGAATLF